MIFKFNIDIITYKMYSRPRILEHGSESVSKNKSKIELRLEWKRNDSNIAKSKTIRTEYFTDKTVAHP